MRHQDQPNSEHKWLFIYATSALLLTYMLLCVLHDVNDSAAKADMVSDLGLRIMRPDCPSNFALTPATQGARAACHDAVRHGEAEA
jgi:hypothetical protein